MLEELLAQLWAQYVRPVTKKRFLQRCTARLDCWRGGGLSLGHLRVFTWPSRVWAFDRKTQSSLWTKHSYWHNHPENSETLPTVKAESLSIHEENVIVIHRNQKCNRVTFRHFVGWWLWKKWIFWQMFSDVVSYFCLTFLHYWIMYISSNES
jgi:hypothetical protein